MKLRDAIPPHANDEFDRLLRETPPAANQSVPAVDSTHPARPRDVGFDFSAGPRVPEATPDTTRHAVGFANQEVPRDGPSLFRRALRGLTRFVIAACIGVAATLAWQSYGGTAKQMMASWARQQGWAPSLLTAMGLAATPGPAGEQHSGVAGDFTALELGSGSKEAPPQDQGLVVASTAPALQYPSLELPQLEPIVRDLAAMRQDIEKLTAGQEEMAREIAKLQSTELDIQSRISAPVPWPVAPASRPVEATPQPPAPLPRSQGH